MQQNNSVPTDYGVVRVSEKEEVTQWYKAVQYNLFRFFGSRGGRAYGAKSQQEKEYSSLCDGIAH